MNKKIIFALLIIFLAFFVYKTYFKTDYDTTLSVLSFEDCAKAGYPVMESYPRQCATKDGRVFTEEITPQITYNNVLTENIVVDLPFPGAVTGKEFKAIGKAKGFMFEASFPVEVLDKDGNRLFLGPAHATIEDWMVDALVPFEIDVKIPETYIGPATIIFRKDNVSDMRELDGSISFPITIEY